MDEIDRDQAFEEAVLAAQLAARAPMPMQQANGEDCLRCDEMIDARRRAAVPGCALCVTCQAKMEKLHR